MPADRRTKKQKERDDKAKVRLAAAAERPARLPYLPRWGAPRVEFDERRQLTFLEHYRKTGLIGLSAETAGVSPGVPSEFAKRNAEFAASMKAAKDLWVEDVLLPAAMRRAIHGTQRPIVGGKFRDEVVAYETVHSDTLMVKMLDAHAPELFSKDKAAQAGTGGGVLVIPAAPTTASDWEAQFGELAKGDTGREILDD